MKELEVRVSHKTFQEILNRMNEDLRFNPGNLGQRPWALVFYNGRVIPGVDLYITEKAPPRP